MKKELETELETAPVGKENETYRVKSGDQDFNPQYTLMDGSLNINPLSARSCRCFPCRCK